MVNNQEKSFTLIELLVVLALVAILSVVVILTLNPSELIKQARDSNRLSDLSTINTALNLFSADVTSGFMGTSTVVYVSIPDNTSSTCGSLGLPTLPNGYTYKCATTATLRNTDGTGWIPVNFQQISSNSPISQLPIDPINTTSSGNYYTYVSGGSWILTAIPESTKQKTELSASPHIQNYPGVIGMGNNLNLSPLYNPNGLVGYWKFDEGSGTTAKDSSGNGNSGTLSSSLYWANGKINSSIDFNQGAMNMTVPNATTLNIPNAITISFWVRTLGVTTGNTGSYIFAKWTGTNDANYTILWYSHDSWCPDCIGLVANVGGAWAGVTPYTTLPADEGWHLLTTTYDSATSKGIAYLDAILTTSSTVSGALATNSNQIMIGSIPPTFHATIDDIRIYNRALSAAEILALYNATK